MDAFFWAFDKKCKDSGIAVDWFFPNPATHGAYTRLNIIPKTQISIEATFLEYCKGNSVTYSHVFTHFLELCTPFFRNVKKATDAVVIAVDHNPRPLAGYPVSKQIKKRIKGFLYASYVNVFVGVSNYTVRELIKDFGNSIRGKTQTIYNGVLISEIVERKERAESNPKFLVASHLRESKGIQDLIAAVAMLPNSLKNRMSIDVFGDGPYKEVLLAQLAKLQLGKQFRFQGSSDSLKETFCKYDYLLHPTHMECFSLTLLESLAANVPVITTPVGGNTEVVRDGENGFLFEAQNGAQLALLLEHLILGKKKITGYTRTEIAERFTVERMVDKYIQLIQ
ncbi:MAG: group 1 glycosyl transferase [Flavobacteriaceae bacterium]|nr:group 1 glycosyl transferase [Flavobacteriaceae bacterium]